MKGLSIIIVNYNGKKFLKNCITSIVERCNSFPYEIILLDNASSDESCHFIKTQFPEVILIENTTNVGFAKGNNMAANYAKYNTLLLLNNDTILLDSIVVVFNYLQTNEKVGAATIQMLNGEKKYSHSVGKFPSIRNLTFMKQMFYDEKYLLDKDTVKEIDWISGSFLMIRKEIWNKVGGFSEDYFMYVEDVDFSKILENINLKRVFFPALKYIHFVGFNQAKIPIVLKNYFIYINKYFFGIKKCLAKFIIIYKIKKHYLFK